MPDENGIGQSTKAAIEQQSANIPTQTGIARVLAGRNDEYEVSVWDHEGCLHIDVTRQSQLIVSLTVPTVAVDAPTLSFTTPITLPTQKDHEVSVEYPSITIEGYVGRTPAYRDSKHPDHIGEKELFFPLSYRPNPQNREIVVWYDIYFFGAKADELNRKTTLAKGKAVNVMGTDHTHTVIKKSREGQDSEKTIHEVHGNEATTLKRSPKPMTA
jgi:hypothetical protein